MVSIEIIERKVRQAEEKAWKVIEEFRLPRRLDGHGPSLADLEAWETSLPKHQLTSEDGGNEE